MSKPKLTLREEIEACNATQLKAKKKQAQAKLDELSDQRNLLQNQRHHLLIYLDLVDQRLSQLSSADPEAELKTAIDTLLAPAE